MFGGTPKKSFFLPPLDHITIDQRRANRALITSWCIM